MSFCRWSSDNWRCDLYCFGDARGGYTTYVGGNRIVGDIPPEPDWGNVPLEEACAQHRKVLDFLDKAERQDIDLPYAGETFNDPTLLDFKNRLLHLRSIGYNFPDYVLERVEAEIKESSNGPS